MSDEKLGSITLTPEALRDLINEIRKPDELRQKEIDKANKLEERRIQAMCEMAREEEKARKLTKAGCAHKKENGQWTLSGQITSDGKVTQICQRCQMIWKSDPDPRMQDGSFSFNGVGPLPGNKILE